MIRKNTIGRASLIAAFAFCVQTSFAQDVHFTQFNAAPLTINPAFTGNFSGQWRASGIYRDQWRGVGGFQTYAMSFDAPIVNDLSHDDYLAAGVQLYNDRAGDANLSNISALASIAYHKFLGGGSEDPNKALSVGFQGGYTQKSIDLTKLYFQDEFNNQDFQQGTSGEYPNLNNKVNYFTVNAGISWAHSVGSRFSYVLGVGANNLNQPQESFKRKRNADAGLGMRYTGQVGAKAFLSDRFSLRPAVLYQQQASATEIVAGNEFHYILGNPEYSSFTSAVFVGGWVRPGDAFMATAGLEFKGFRIGFSYDRVSSDLKNATSGGFEIALTYLAPDPLDFARRLVYPCSRF
ncbi:MAG: type IX secretion system membrane protein PorP/SprF [Sphingobacteriales bacterium]|nr:MAG: type IX secretion system membrane protein PorP/SprF [Sphingobacteriales bacterium]